MDSINKEVDMSEEIRIVAIKYTCPLCKRSHQKGISGDWFEENIRVCTHCGVEMWHEEVKKTVTKES